MEILKTNRMIDTSNTTLNHRTEASRYRWVILGVLWITYIVVFLHRLSAGPLAPFFKEEFGLTNAQVGLVMSAAAFGYPDLDIAFGKVYIIQLYIN